MKYLVLSNGNSLPIVGLGTWQIRDRELLRKLIKKAYASGYRMLDTAAAYSNEIGVAKAIRENEIPREEIYIIDKVWNTCRGFEEVQDACKNSLKKLKTEYLDLYLIHYPASPKSDENWNKINAETWRGMEKLYREGYVKAIGVCNYKIHHLEELKKTYEICPMVNQIELHPGLFDVDMYKYCQEKGIILQAASPLGNGQILHNEKLKEIARKRERSVAQICLKWEIQKNISVIPKTSNLQRLEENIEIFDFELTEEETDIIDKIPYCGGLNIDSDEVIKFE